MKEVKMANSTARRGQEGRQECQEVLQARREGQHARQKGHGARQEGHEVGLNAYAKDLHDVQLYLECQQIQHCCLAVVAMYLQETEELNAERQRQRRLVSFWVKPWLTQRRKEEKGACFQLMRELEEQDVPAFICYH